MVQNTKNGKKIIALATEEWRDSAQKDLIQYATLSEQYTVLSEQVESLDVSPEEKQSYEEQLQILGYRLEDYNNYIYNAYGFYPIGVDTLEDVSKYSIIVEDDLAEASIEQNVTEKGIEIE